MNQTQNTQAKNAREKLQPTFALKKLQGIKPKGVKLNSTPVVNKLIDIESRMFDHFYYNPPKRKIDLYYSLLTSSTSAGVVNEILTLWSKPFLDNIVFSQSDLENYVLSRSIQDLSDGSESYFIGFYSGILLSTLTERNFAEGKRTRIYLDGLGNNFDYLFTHANKIDQLIVENFNGDRICSNMGAFGSFKSIAAINCSGDYILYDCSLSSELPAVYALINSKGDKSGRGYANGALVIIKNYEGGSNNINEKNFICSDCVLSDEDFEAIERIKNKQGKIQCTKHWVEADGVLIQSGIYTSKYLFKDDLIKIADLTEKLEIVDGVEKLKVLDEIYQIKVDSVNR